VAALTHLADGDAADCDDDVAYLLSVRSLLAGAL
jgi:hypothetical protein